MARFDWSYTGLTSPDVQEAKSRHATTHSACCTSSCQHSHACGAKAVASSIFKTMRSPPTASVFPRYRAKKGVRGSAWENNLMAQQHRSLFNPVGLWLAGRQGWWVANEAKKQSKKSLKKRPSSSTPSLWSLRLSFYFNHILAVRVKRARIKACLCWGEGGGDTQEEPVAALIASSHSAWFPVLSQCVTLSLTVVTCLSLCVCVSLSHFSQL